MNVMMMRARPDWRLDFICNVWLALLLFGAGALLPPYVEAGCVGTSVAAFDAKGDGHTDDTGSIQRAINAAAAARGGPVVFNVARYHTTGTFTLPRGVVFCGDTTQLTNAQHVIEVTAKDTAGQCRPVAAPGSNCQQLNVGLLQHPKRTSYNFDWRTIIFSSVVARGRGK